MPRHQQRVTQSDDEHSTPPTPRSPNQEHHGRIEAWFEDHKDNIQVFLIEMKRKQISIPKVLRFSWLRDKGFESLFQQLKHQRLKSFLELSGKIYPDLVKVFFTNLEFKNDMLLSSIKGFHMEINKKAWKDVVGLKLTGVQVTKVLIPHGSNHSTLDKGDLILMYCVQHNIQADWICVS